jgi:hypothetical protein
MSYPHILHSVTPREAITDAIYRVLLGLDRYDISIFNSAFAGEDIIFELRDGNTRTITSVSAWRKEILDHIGPMDTTHMISNVRVDIKEGADTASLTSYVVAQHCLPGTGRDPNSPKYLVGAEYFTDLVRDDTDGLWKIKKWVVDTIWSQGDASVMPKPS